MPRVMASDAYTTLEARFAAGDRGVAAEIFALADGGDADALLKTAEFRMRAIGGPSDLVDAFDRTRRAAAAGLVEARRAEAYLTAAGIGTSADPKAAARLLAELAAVDRFAALQFQMIARMSDLKVTRTTVSRDPAITVFHDLLSADECRYLMTVANPAMEPAMIYAATGEGMRDPHRDSDNMAISPLSEDFVVKAFLGRIADVSQSAMEEGEPLHVLRYRPGQQYRPHHDAHAFAPVTKRRRMTAILYLNNGYAGGETAFPELGIEVRGVAGDLLLFDNLDRAGEPDPRMLHAGKPVTRGEKWIATRWIRGSDYFGRTGSSSEESP